MTMEQSTTSFPGVNILLPVLNADLHVAPDFTGRVVVHFDNGRAICHRRLRDSEHVTTLDGFKRTFSAIDLALQKHTTPVGPLFVAERHGRMKKCFSRDTAIRYPAYFLTTHAFSRSGFKEHHPDVRIDRDDMEVWRRGETTTEYLCAHQRCVRRLRRILARKREMQKWCEKWDGRRDRFMKEYDELQATKPAGVRG